MRSPEAVDVPMAAAASMMAPAAYAEIGDAEGSLGTLLVCQGSGLEQWHFPAGARQVSAPGSC